jgi:anti-sigma factor RsiW
MEWLNAYHDGELKGHRLHQVEEHLASCETCQMELDSLQGLSKLLKSDPLPELNERFVSNVNLLLPHKQTAPRKRSLLEAGWWVVPVGLLAAWIFISTAVLVSNIVTVADSIGALDDTTSAWIGNPQETVNVTATLGQFGLLQENSLQWAERSENYTRNILPPFFWHACIAIVYLAWMAIWWTRQTRAEQEPALEG